MTNALGLISDKAELLVAASIGDLEDCKSNKPTTCRRMYDVEIEADDRCSLLRGVEPLDIERIHQNHSRVIQGEE